MKTAFFLLTMACVAAPAVLGHIFARDPRRSGFALYFFLCSGAFFWLLAVDLTALFAGGFAISIRAAIFRALMFGGYLFLIYLVAFYRRR